MIQKNKKLLVILDPAHGKETPGKRSPDGVHREYEWSRWRLKSIAPQLEELGYTVLWTNETDTEIGLSKRKNIASEIAKANKDKVSLLISLHNDAATLSSWQNKASGISVWTSKGRTTSDIFADVFIQNLPEFLPDVQRRLYSHSYLDRDFEENFTVLMGAYSAMLIECMFQDNKEDVALLASPFFCAKVDEWIIDSIEKCNQFIINKSL